MAVAVLQQILVLVVEVAVMPQLHSGAMAVQVL